MSKKIVVFLFCSMTAMHVVSAGAGRSAARWGGLGVGAAASLLIIAAQAKIKTLEQAVKRGAVALADADLERLYVLRNWAIGFLGLGGSLFAGSLLSNADQFGATSAVADPAGKEGVIVKLPELSGSVPLEPTMPRVLPALPESESAPAIALSKDDVAAASSPMSMAVGLSSVEALSSALVSSVLTPSSPISRERRQSRASGKPKRVVKPPLTVIKDSQDIVPGVVGATLSMSVAGNLTDDIIVRKFLGDLSVEDKKGIAFFEANAPVTYADNQLVSRVVSEITTLVSNDGAPAGHFLNFDFSLSRDELFSVFHTVKIPGDGHCAGHCYIFFKSGLADVPKQPYYFGASFNALADARKRLFQERLAQVPKRERKNVTPGLRRSIGMGHWKKGASQVWETDMPRSQINTSLPAPVDSQYYLGQEDVLLIAKILHKPVLIWTGADEGGYRISYSAGLSQKRWEGLKQDVASCCHILFSQTGSQLDTGGRGHWSVLVPNPLPVETKKEQEEQ